MLWGSGNAEAPGGRLKRLAQSIETLAEKDEGFQRESLEMAQVRRGAANELYTICHDFVNSLNRLMSKGEVVLDPEQFSEAAFQEDAVNLIQISVRGRILQVAFSATIRFGARVQSGPARKGNHRGATAFLYRGEEPEPLALLRSAYVSFGHFRPGISGVGDGTGDLRQRDWAADERR
jgi:hypothetical protein